MSFNSYLFILLFLPITLLVYYILGQRKKYKEANVFIVLMSMLFYGYYNPVYLIVLVINMIVNYMLSIMLRNSKNKGLLSFSIIYNVGLLLYFKYYNFFINSINSLFYTSFNTKSIVLPLAISFYTFSNISFIVDIYNSEIKEHSFIDYALYISFFPKMVQGPLVNYCELISQFNDEKLKKINWERIQNGMFLFIFGLCKKVLIADVLAKAVNWGYSNIYELDSFNSAFIILSYTFQIYYDFSGYSDMARGVAYLFNIELPINFNSPYLAKNISEFWKRWHISLTNFLTKYIYIPLGGNRKGKSRTYLNVLLVFVISGLWHGASWNYVLWGLLNGLLMVAYRMKKEMFDKVPKIISWIITFVLINILWIVFRSTSLNDIQHMFASLFNYKEFAFNKELLSCFEINVLNYVPESFEFIRIFKTSRLYPLVYLFISFVLIIYEQRIIEIISRKEIKKIYFYLFGLLLIMCILSFTNNTSFIYVGF